MPKPTVTPQPLYIADKNERLIDMLVDELFEALVREVEAEEANNSQIINSKP